MQYMHRIANLQQILTLACCRCWTWCSRTWRCVCRCTCPTCSTLRWVLEAGSTLTCSLSSDLPSSTTRPSCGETASAVHPRPSSKVKINNVLWTRTQAKLRVTLVKRTMGSSYKIWLYWSHIREIISSIEQVNMSICMSNENKECRESHWVFKGLNVIFKAQNNIC